MADGLVRSSPIPSGDHPTRYLEVEPSVSRTPRSMDCLQVSGISFLEALQRQPRVDPSHRLKLRNKQLAVGRPPSASSKYVHRRPEGAPRQPLDRELDLVGQHCSVPSPSLVPSLAQCAPLRAPPDGLNLHTLPGIGVALMAMCKAAQERRHIRSVVILTQDLADFRRRLAARHEFGKSFLAGYHAVFPYSACMRVGDSYHAPIRIRVFLWSLSPSRLSRQKLLTWPRRDRSREQRWPDGFR
jgi:hypothetical protein